MNAPQPLQGLRVVEFTHMVMGPTCGLILADLGVAERRLERLEKDLKKQKNPSLEKEYEVLKKTKGALDKQTPLRELALSAEDERAIREMVGMEVGRLDIHVENIDYEAAKA